MSGQTERAAELKRVGAWHLNRGALEPGRLFTLAALGLEPDDSEALQNLGAALYAEDKFVAAEAILRRALQVEPHNAYTMSNLVAVLMALCKCDEGIAIARRVVELEPLVPNFWFNLGTILYRNNEFPEALEVLEKAIRMNPPPELALDLLNNAAFANLATGHFSRGIKNYEVRWAKGLYRCSGWRADAKPWRGQDLSGKRLLLHCEQGYGDNLMYARFIPEFISKGVEVTLAAQPALIRLFQNNLTCPVIDWENCDGFPADYHSPLMTALGLLGIEKGDIKADPYIDPDKTPLEFKLPPGRRIGIVWASGDHGAHIAKLRRLIPLELFLRFLEIPGVSLVSLQKGAEESDLERLGVEGIISNPMSGVEDFLDTARVIRELDIVVSVESAVAHLAGAMGKPTIMLGPYTQCWRWWSKDCGLPWYEDYSIEHQSMDLSWAGAIDQAKQTVQGFLRREHLNGGTNQIV